MLTSNDKTIGPLTWGPSESRRWDIHLSHRSLTVTFLGVMARLRLPAWMTPRLSPEACFGRRFGVCLFDGHLSFDFGDQTGDSRTEKSWGCFLPWTQWRHVRTSLYDVDGTHLCDEPRGFWGWMALRDAVPKSRFLLEDFDGSTVVATAFAEECEHRLGQGCFRWLSLFRSPRIRRSLNIEFSREVGRDKGSWKGGMVGHGTELIPGESHEKAIRRYCASEKTARSGHYRLTFIRSLAAEDSAGLGDSPARRGDSRSAEAPDA